MLKDLLFTFLGRFSNKNAFLYTLIAYKAFNMPVMKKDAIRGDKDGFEWQSARGKAAQPARYAPCHAGV